MKALSDACRPRATRSRRGGLALLRILRWSDDTAKLRRSRGRSWILRRLYLGHQHLFRCGVAFRARLASRPLSSLARRDRIRHGLLRGARVLVQFFYFDRSEAPPGAFYKSAEVVLVGLFVFLTAVYGYAAVS